MTSIVQIIPVLFSSKKSLNSLIDVLESLKNATKPIRNEINLYTIIFVNNCSSLSDQKKLEKKISHLTIKKIVFLYSSVNKGFTGAVNDSITFGLHAYRVDWFSVINDDAQVTESFYQKFLPFLTQNKYDLLSCKVLNKKGELESNGLGFYSTGLSFPLKENVRKGQIQLICGTCFFISKKVVELRKKTLFGYVLNPLFFAYSEDVELSLWVNKYLKAKTKVLKEGSVTHSGSQTAGKGTFFQLYLGLRNSLFIPLLFWSKKDFLLNLPLLLIGQLYVILLTFYKGYWLLYPKIVKNFIDLSKTQLFFREKYNEKSYK